MPNKKNPILSNSEFGSVTLSHETAIKFQGAKQAVSKFFDFFPEPESFYNRTWHLLTLSVSGGDHLEPYRTADFVCTVQQIQKLIANLYKDQLNNNSAISYSATEETLKEFFDFFQEPEAIYNHTWEMLSLSVLAGRHLASNQRADFVFTVQQIHNLIDNLYKFHQSFSNN